MCWGGGKAWTGRGEERSKRGGRESRKKASKRQRGLEVERKRRAGSRCRGRDWRRPAPSFARALLRRPDAAEERIPPDQPPRRALFPFPARRAGLSTPTRQRASRPMGRRGRREREKPRPSPLTKDAGGRGHAGPSPSPSPPEGKPEVALARRSTWARFGSRPGHGGSG